MVARAKQKADPSAVVSAWHREVAAGRKRGAYQRVAEQFGISDQSVMRYVAADEQQAVPAPPTADDVAYVPAPGEVAYQAERARVAAQLAVNRHKSLTPEPTSLPQSCHKPRPRCHTKRHNQRLVICGKLMSNVATVERKLWQTCGNLPQPRNATRHTLNGIVANKSYHHMPQLPHSDYPLIDQPWGASVNDYRPRRTGWLVIAWRWWQRYGLPPHVVVAIIWALLMIWLAFPH